MSQLKPIRLHPTFPLDAVKIRRLKRHALQNSPRLWLPWLLGRLAAMFRSGKSPEAPDGGSLADAALSYWQDLDNELTAGVIKQMVQQSNQQQDEQLQRLINQLRASGNSQYAISMGKFLLLKQHIEIQLHADGELTARKQSIEQLVDSLCNEVCEQIYHLAQMDGQLGKVLTSRDPQQLERLSALRHTGYRRILDAYGAVYDTAQHLHMMLHPGRDRPVDSDSNQASLDRLIAILREEHDLSRKVHDRIREELPRLEEHE